ncbi:MAG: hypothetical protein KDK07_16520 [Bauldia sp.]|nr:hypothetical protein [Bauldia sp.]
MDLQWWISVIEIPALVGLFWLVQSYKTAGDKAIESIREEVSEFKLHVATNYASLAYLKDVEARLVQHLLKIEAKLDRVVEHRPPAE